MEKTDLVVGLITKRGLQWANTWRKASAAKERESLLGTKDYIKCNYENLP